MFRTPKRGTDLRHVETGLSDAERLQAIQECALLRQKRLLGQRWVAHPANAPAKGIYNPLTGARLA
jgi:hypothetical protein